MTQKLLRSRILCPPLAAATRHWHVSRASWLASTAMLGRSGDSAHELAEAKDLLEDHFTHLTNIIYHLEIEVERRGAIRLVTGIVPDVEIWVLEGLLNADTRARVERQHAIQEIESIWIGVGKELRKWPFGHEWQVSNILLSARRSNPGERLFVGSAKNVQYLVQLVDVVAAFEEGSATEKLRKNAANRPDINYFQELHVSVCPEKSKPIY